MTTLLVHRPRRVVDGVPGAGGVRLRRRHAARRGRTGRARPARVAIAHHRRRSGTATRSGSSSPAAGDVRRLPRLVRRPCSPALYLGFVLLLVALIAARGGVRVPGPARPRPGGAATWDGPPWPVGQPARPLLDRGSALSNSVARARRSTPARVTSAASGACFSRLLRPRGTDVRASDVCAARRDLSWSIKTTGRHPGPRRPRRPGGSPRITAARGGGLRHLDPRPRPTPGLPAARGPELAAILAALVSRLARCARRPRRLGLHRHRRHHR